MFYSYWYLAVIALSFGGATLAMPVFAGFAARLGLVDDPGGRKRHAHSTPVTGGPTLAISALAMVGLAGLVLGWSPPSHGWFVLSPLILAFCGAVDDSHELGWLYKSICQLAVVLLLTRLGHVEVRTLGPIFGGASVDLGHFAVPFTALVLVGFINALNMMDGIDGLAGGLSLVALAILAICAALAQRADVLLPALCFGGATAGFLLYNMRSPWRTRAVVFLGDSGSQMLGLVVGACAILLAGRPSHALLSPMGAAWVLALPVMDTVVVMLRRIAHGRSPFSADRLHIHHVLMDLGLTCGRTTGVLLAVAAAYGLFGLLGSFLGLSAVTFFLAFLVILVGHAAFVAYAQARLSAREGAIVGEEGVIK